MFNKCRLALVEFIAQSKNKLKLCMETKRTNALQTYDAKATDTTQNRDITAINVVQECDTNVRDAVQDCESRLVDTAQDCDTAHDFETNFVLDCDSVQNCNSVQDCDSVQECEAKLLDTVQEGVVTVHDSNTTQTSDTKATDTTQDCDINAMDIVQECDTNLMDTVQVCESSLVDTAQNCDTIQDCGALLEDTVQDCDTVNGYEAKLEDTVQDCDVVQDCDTVQDLEAKLVVTVQNQETEVATSPPEEPQQDAAANTKCVRFKAEVDVLHFNRQLSLDRIPMDRRFYPIGMASKPFHRDARPLPETSPNARRAPSRISFPQRREMLLSCFKKLTSTPRRARRMKKLILDYNAVNKSRINSLRGCGCEGEMCNPNSCECAVNEIPCHMSMCGCSVYGCGNTHGRMMRDRDGQQRHYDQTFSRLFQQYGKFPVRRRKQSSRPCLY